MKPTNKINNLWVKDGTFFIEGLAYIQGYNSPDFSDLYKSLIFINVQTHESFEYELGSIRRPELNAQHYEGQTYNYTAAGTATKGLKGVNVALLDVGIYEIKLSVSTSSTNKKYLDLSLAFNALDKRSIDDWFEYRLYQKNGKTYLVKREVMGRRADQYAHLNLTSHWVNGRTIHLEGEFIVPGADLYDFTQGKYYLIFKKPISQKQYAFELGQIKKPNLGKKIDNSFGDYDACYFATINLAGVNTAGFELGDYEIYVSLGYKSEIFTAKLSDVLLRIDRSGVCQLMEKQFEV